MARLTFIKCLLYTEFMNYLFESHKNPMELDMITLLVVVFPLHSEKNKKPESKLICPGSQK